MTDTCIALNVTMCGMNRSHLMFAPIAEIRTSNKLFIYWHPRRKDKMKLHAVNVVEGGIPTDKRKKVSVRIVLVQARDKEHAMEEAARGFASRDNFLAYSFFYRNEFEDGPIDWAFQTWERSDFDDVVMRTGSEILEEVEQ
jgi:hypothetical protein